MNDTRHTVLLRDSESHHLSLPVRQSIKPSNPDYDRIAFAHLRARCIIQPNGCWEIQGTRHQSKGMTHAGYGDFCYRGRAHRAHRVAYMLAKGPIPDGHVVAHSCDNPPCCNPAHLSTCTESENILDAVSKKRDRNTRRTHCIHGHELAGENLIISNKGRRRQCRACQDAYHKSPKYIAWRRAYQRVKRGWSKEDAHRIPAVPAGQRTRLRVIGTRNITDDQQNLQK